VVTESDGLPPNQRLHLTRARFEVLALDCLPVERGGRAAPVAGDGRCRAGETHNR
jgi:hypothetical protein